MKPEIDSPEKLTSWIQNPTVPAIFQSVDLRNMSHAITGVNLDGCAFLGCKVTGDILQAAANSSCLVMPPIEGQSFDPFRAKLYSPEELYDQFKVSEPEASYENCLDKKIYDSYKKNGKVVPVDVDVTISRRIHDASISDALDDILTLDKRKKPLLLWVGMMLVEIQKYFRILPCFVRNLAKRAI